MKKIISILLIIIIGFLMMANNLSKPFYGHHDWNSVQYSNIARNYLRYGYSKIKFGQITSTGIQQLDQLHYSTHYPPTLPLLISFSFKLLGINETSARLIPLIFSLGLLILLFLISRKLKFSYMASLASTTVAFTPMLRYFAKMPVHEVLIVFFSTLSVYFYLRFIQSSSRNNLIKFLISAFLNGYISWPGYFLYPFLVIHAYIYHRKLYKKVAICLLALSLSFALHLFHIYILTGVLFGGNMIDSLLFRLNLSQAINPDKIDLVQFTWPKYFIQEIRWNIIYYTRIFIIASIIFTFFSSFKIIKRQPLTRAESLIIALLFFPLSYILIFSNMVFIHDYFNIFFLPFFALSFAWLINKLNKFSFKLVLPVFIVLSFFIATERLEFFQAHQNSNMHQTGYELGKLINQIVPQEESAAVFSINYANHHSIFIDFYADRNIYYTGYSQNQWDQFINDQLPQINHIFIVNTHKLDNQIVDKALATRSASFKNYGQFNYYLIDNNVNIR